MNNIEEYRRPVVDELRTARQEIAAQRRDLDWYATHHPEACEQISRLRYDIDEANTKARRLEGDKQIYYSEIIALRAGLEDTREHHAEQYRGLLRQQFLAGKSAGEASFQGFADERYERERFLEAKCQTLMSALRDSSRGSSQEHSGAVEDLQEGYVNEMAALETYLHSEYEEKEKRVFLYCMTLGSELQAAEQEMPRLRAIASNEARDLARERLSQEFEEQQHSHVIEEHRKWSTRATEELQQLRGEMSHLLESEQCFLVSSGEGEQSIAAGGRSIFPPPPGLERVTATSESTRASSDYSAEEISLWKYRCNTVQNRLLALEENAESEEAETRFGFVESSLLPFAVQEFHLAQQDRFVASVKSSLSEDVSSAEDAYTAIACLEPFVESWIEDCDHLAAETLVSFSSPTVYTTGLDFRAEARELRSLLEAASELSVGLTEAMSGKR